MKNTKTTSVVGDFCCWCYYDK